MFMFFGVVQEDKYKYYIYSDISVLVVVPSSVKWRTKFRFVVRQSHTIQNTRQRHLKTYTLNMPEKT